MKFSRVNIYCVLDINLPFGFTTKQHFFLHYFELLFLTTLTSGMLQNGTAEKVITNDDVLGDAVPYDQQEALRVLCYRLLEMPLVSILFLMS